MPGYVAKRSATGSKTDTLLLETPQAVNVVTRAQMDDQGARTVAEALRYTPGVLAEPNGFDVRYDWNYIRYAFEHRFDDIWSVRQNLRYGLATQDMFLVRAHPFNALQADGRTINRVSAISGGPTFLPAVITASTNT